MKLLHQAAPDVVLRLENRTLRRENTELQDELASVRRELEKARAALAADRAEIDDLLDLASTYTLSAPAERLAAAHTWPWERFGCHENRPLTVDQARTVMQQHRLCMTGKCTVRTTAVATLRDGGHLIPDAGRRTPIPS
ncbi:hypothetical protein [Nocardia flavorosea]|uniref:Uncharacterized protein n=1 Tax=Nocardia flavorosea TaxID=53429 RepID=A0A846YU62_9NOCA|nr:hypothetical protein [Nocardia flavorosea]NKY60994.1 hypothetical protein [Nocardia flavorosea]